MKSTLISAAVGALFAGLVFTGYSAIAQNGGDRTSRHQMTAEQITAKADARIARLKAALRLTSEQEKDWSGVETALHDIAKKRADRLIARRAERAEKKDPVAFPDRLQRRADALSNRSADLKAVAGAVKTLYGALDERQKDRLEGRISRFVDRGID
jgi:hypothetical protein